MLGLGSQSGAIVTLVGVGWLVSKCRFGEEALAAKETNMAN